MSSITATASQNALERHLQGVDGNLHLVHLQTQNIKLNIIIHIFTKSNIFFKISFPFPNFYLLLPPQLKINIQDGRKSDFLQV